MEQRTDVTPEEVAKDIQDRLDKIQAILDDDDILDAQKLDEIADVV